MPGPAMHTEAETFCRYDCPMLFALSWGRIPQLICLLLILQSLAVTPPFGFLMGDPKAQVSSAERDWAKFTDHRWAHSQD